MYSASVDSSIRIWALPAPSSPFDSTPARGESICHMDAVWDLALVWDISGQDAFIGEHKTYSLQIRVLATVVASSLTDPLDLTTH